MAKRPLPIGITILKKKEFKVKLYKCIVLPTTRPTGVESEGAFSAAKIILYQHGVTISRLNK